MIDLCGKKPTLMSKTDRERYYALMYCYACASHAIYVTNAEYKSRTSLARKLVGLLLQRLFINC